MKKIIVLSVLLGFMAMPVSAQATSISVQELIANLKKQMEDLMAQITVLNAQLEQVKSTQQDVKETLKLKRELKEGMSGEDVTLLQQVLATDPEIYPEGKITGYFGKLTAKAVKKFQLKMKVEQVGNVGPKTLAKINELLTEGAGSSGKVPPGLLIAPGIKKKITFTLDITAPVISGLQATNITASSTVVVWTTNEISDSKIWYGISTPVVATATSTLYTSSASKVLNHELSLSNLSATTTYFYLVASADASGNATTSVEQAFSTP